MTKELKDMFYSILCDYKDVLLSYSRDEIKRLGKYTWEFKLDKDLVKKDFARYCQLIGINVSNDAEPYREGEFNISRWKIRVIGDMTGTLYITKPIYGGGICVGIEDVGVFKVNQYDYKTWLDDIHRIEA